MILTTQERSDILKEIIKKGLWAILFTALLVYVLVSNNDRENRYVKTINRLVEELPLIRQELKEIKLLVTED